VKVLVPVQVVYARHYRSGNKRDTVLSLCRNCKSPLSDVADVDSRPIELEYRVVFKKRLTPKLSTTFV